MPEIGATRKSVKGLDLEAQSPRWWGWVTVAFPIARMWMGLRERKRQIASTVTIVAIAVAAVVVVVVVIDGVGVNGCAASSSAPEVHLLPGQVLKRM